MKNRDVPYDRPINSAWEQCISPNGCTPSHKLFSSIETACSAPMDAKGLSV